ncbi:MAG: ABC transporter permease [Pseudomonadota bacterium]
MKRQDIQIAFNLAIRDIKNTYARSYLGPVWMLFTPMLMLLVYWCVFGVVLGISWKSTSGDSEIPYILPFFVGLALYLFLADAVSSSLKTYVSKRAYVQRTPVPLWVLWLSNLFRSMLQFGSSVAILVAIIGYYGYLSFSGLTFALLVVLLFVVAVAAISLLLSTLGPFFGDIENTVGPLLRVVFYSAPITYPLTFIPSPYSDYLLINPLSIPATQIRRAIIEQQPPDIALIMPYLLVALLFFGIAFFFHTRLKKVVPDVV